MSKCIDLFTYTELHKYQCGKGHLQNNLLWLQLFVYAKSLDIYICFGHPKWRPPVKESEMAAMKTTGYDSGIMKMIAFPLEIT